MMKKANDDLLFLDEDNQLEEVTELKWLPWIGKEYFNTEHRLLIVGESHYLTGKEKNLLEAEQPDFTRNVVQTFCINNKIKGKSGSTSVQTDGIFDENTFELSMPIGLSYEFSNFVIEGRYNFGLTKAFKDMDNKNSVFQFTVGYKLPL